MNGVKRLAAGSAIFIVVLTVALLSWTTRKQQVVPVKPVDSLDHLPLSLGLITDGANSFQVVIEESGEVVSAPYQVSRITRVRFEPRPVESDLLVKLQRFFEAGGFYFSKQPDLFDVTRRQQRSVDPSMDDYFVANQRLLNAAKKGGGESKYKYVEVILGLVRSEVLDGIHCMMITRHCPIRTGPRLHSRGTDKEGNTSLTLETELVLSSGMDTVSHTTLRGTVPFRWQQPRGWSNPNTMPTFSEDVEENAKMMEKHVRILQRIYGPQVLAVSLLNFTGIEQPFGDMYAAAAAKVPDLYLHRFSHHTAVKQKKTKWAEGLIEPIRQRLKDIGFYSTVSGARQQGVVRVSCLSVLDRTSVAQAKLMVFMLDAMLDELKITAESIRTQIAVFVRSAWVDTAHYISLQSSGTVAQQTDVIMEGYKTLRGNVDDFMASVGRYWSTNRLHDDLFAVIKLALGYSD